MSQVSLSESVPISGQVAEWRFDGEHAGQRVRGLLWLPKGTSRSHSLVLIGHAGFSHKRSAGVLRRAEEIVARHGMAAAAIDAPLHGERRSQEIADPWMAWLAYWKRTGATDFAQEWRATIEILRSLPEVGRGPIGYWGLSLATQYGLALLAREPRIQAAVLGCFGMVDSRLSRYAAEVACPVFFIQQLGDQFHSVNSTRQLFDLLATPDKKLRASPGDHFYVPDSTLQEAAEFLVAALSAALPRAKDDSSADPKG